MTKFFAVLFFSLLIVQPSSAGTEPVASHGVSSRRAPVEGELRGAYNDEQEIAWSPCAQSILAMQQHMHRKLFSSYENFKTLQLKGWFPGVKKWRIERLYSNIIRKFVLDSNPERLCSEGDLFYETTVDAITGAGRASIPHGYFIEIEKELQNLGNLLKNNQKSIGLNEDTFEKAIFSDLRDAYWAVRKERDKAQRAFRRAQPQT